MSELVKPGTSQLAASVEPLWPCLSNAAPSHHNEQVKGLGGLTERPTKSRRRYRLPPTLTHLELLRAGDRQQGRGM